MKKIISFLLILSFVLSSMTIKSFAKLHDNRLPDYHKRDYIEDDGSRYRKVYDDNGNEVELDRTIYVKTDSEGKESLPETYDSRDYNRVTYAKNQGRFGTCWAFAFCGAAESSLISQKYSNIATDLSESHLVYFRGENYDEESDNPALHDKYIRSNVNDFLFTGGNDFQSMAAVARWSGFVDENDFKYDKLLIDPNTYSKYNIFNHKYDLKSAKIYSNDQRDEIKKAIMRSGAVTTSFFSSNDYLLISYDYSSFFSYQNEYNYANHEVIVVGWDDNYSREEYFASNQLSEFSEPPGKGAWLIKNSWGYNNGDYIWISYYDTSLTLYTELNVKPSGDYDNNYQYDGTFCTGGMGFTNTVYGANIFKAKENENLKGCGFYAFDAMDYEVTAYVYKNLADLNNPTSGILTTSKTIEISQEGYYTLDFDEETQLSEGDNFSVVIQYSSSSESARLPYEDMTDKVFTYSAEKGQSYYSSDGDNWTDITDEQNKGNIPIKAFTSDVLPGEIQSLRIIQNPLQHYYCAEYGYLSYEHLDTTDMITELVFTDGTTYVMPNEKLQFSKISRRFLEPDEPTITVSYHGFSDSFRLKVEYRTCIGYELISPPQKLTYYEGDVLNLSEINVKIYFNDGRSSSVGAWTDRVKNYTLIYSDGTLKSNNTKTTMLSVTGLQTVRLFFQTDYKSQGFVDFEINVLPLEVCKLYLKYPDKEHNYNIGDIYTWEPIIVEYNSGITEEINSGYTVTGYNPTKAGLQTIKIEYKGAELTYDIFFIGTDVEYIRLIGNYKTEYYQKQGYNVERFNTQGILLELVCKNDVVRKKSISDVSFSGFNYNVPGKHKIAVYYYDLETYYYINNYIDYFDDNLKFDNVDLFLTGKEKGKTLDDYLLYKQTNSYFFSSNVEATGSAIELRNRIWQGSYVLKTYTLVIFGDVNCDGVYDGRDAVMLNCIVSGMHTKEQVGDAVWKAADCNHDGEINEADIELLNSAGVLTADVSQSSIV